MLQGSGSPVDYSQQTRQSSYHHKLLQVGLLFEGLHFNEQCFDRLRNGTSGIIPDGVNPFSGSKEIRHSVRSTTQASATLFEHILVHYCNSKKNLRSSGSVRIFVVSTGFSSLEEYDTRTSESSLTSSTFIREFQNTFANGLEKQHGYILG